MGDFRMPALGAGMDRGRLLEWRVAPGDTVARGDVVALVETDKAAIEVEVFEDGVVTDLVVAEGTSVPVGTVLAHVGAAASVAAGPASATAPPPTRPSGGRASPYARRLAAERGVDVAGVWGSGPGGAVIARDVETAQPAAPAVRDVAVVRERATPETPPMRRAIARATELAATRIPQYHLAHHVDLEATMQWLDARNADLPTRERILPTALVVAATARVARSHPACNGHWVDDALQPSTRVHVGVAISLRGGGLIAPAVHDADQLAIDDLMARLRDLVRRARSGGLRGSELTDATITVTSLGDQGVETVHGILNPPQVALVGAGRVTARPWVVDGEIVPRRTMHLTLSADHRASDGHAGARFLREVAAHLEEPSSW